MITQILQSEIKATHIQIETHSKSGDTLFCGAYAFGDPIQTIGEQAPQLKT